MSGGESAATDGGRLGRVDSPCIVAVTCEVSAKGTGVEFGEFDSDKSTGMSIADIA